VIKVFRGYCPVQKTNQAINVDYVETRSLSILERWFKKGSLECPQASDSKACKECLIYKNVPNELKMAKER
jgi:hypothetical protein